MLWLFGLLASGGAGLFGDVFGLVIWGCYTIDWLCWLVLVLGGGMG